MSEHTKDWILFILKGINLSLDLIISSFILWLLLSLLFNPLEIIEIFVPYIEFMNYNEP
jgi:hypothetical protein